MKLAVSGCGKIAQIMHIPNVVEHPDLELYALLDPDANRRSVLGDRYDVDHRYSGVEVMLDDVGDELDAAVVCTPMHTHADIAVPILEDGLHVLLEKPIAMTLEDADEIVGAATATPATTMVAYMTSVTT